MTPDVLRRYKPLPNDQPPAPLFDPEDRLLTIKEAAELSRVDETFIRKAARQLQLRLVILGPKTLRIRLGELQRWWKSNQTIGFIAAR